LKKKKLPRQPRAINTPSKKHTRANHFLWKAHIIPALQGAWLLGIMDGIKLVPPEKAEVEKDGKAMLVPNSAYDTWLTKDQLVLSYLLGTQSPEILSQTDGMEHAANMWKLLNSMSALRSKANIVHFHVVLINTKKLIFTGC
jgi:hypothetical protein